MVKQLSLLEPEGRSANKKQSSNNDNNILNQSNAANRLPQLLSVIYQPARITPLLDCVKGLGYKKDNNSQHTNNSLKVILVKLVQKKKINVDNGQYYLSSAAIKKNTLCAIKDGNFEKMSVVAQHNFPLQNSWQGLVPVNWHQAVRDLRIALYLGHERDFGLALKACETHFPYIFQAEDPLYKICFNPFDPDWFSSLPITITSAALVSAFHKATANMVNVDELIRWLIDSHENNNLQVTPELIYRISTFLMLRGEFDRVKKLLPSTDEYRQSMLQGWLSFLAGDNDVAIQYFERSHKLNKKLTKKRKIFIDGQSGVFYLLALLRRNNATDMAQATEFASIGYKKDSGFQHMTFWLFNYLFEFVSGGMSLNVNFKTLPTWPKINSGQEYFFQVLVVYWADKGEAKKHFNSLVKCSAAMKKGGYNWMLAECYELLSRLNKKDEKKYAKLAENLRKFCGFESIIDILKEKAPWERALEAISNISSTTSNETAKKESRLIWNLLFSDSQLMTLSPKEQKQKANGGWSAGRLVSLKRLSDEHESFTSLTEQDKKASRAIYNSNDYWRDVYEIDIERILPILVGHPYLYTADKAALHIELVKGAPEIQVTKKGQHLIITMYPNFEYESKVALIKESECRWKVVESTPEQRQLSDLIGESLKIPKEAKEQVLASLTAVAPFVNIHSDIGGGVNQAENVEADDRIHLLLSPMDEGLKIEARTRVFGDKGPYYQPGSGGQTIIADVDGKQLQATRDLKLEQKNLQTIVSECPELSNIEIVNNEWSIFEPETCLEILLELKEQEDAIVSWPEGEKLKVNQTVSLSDFKMAIKKDNDWFSASGELKLDDGQVLNMSRLMELTRGAKGRFISLADGQFIALTDTFKNRIAELHAFGDEKDGEVKLHPLAAIALDDMASESGKLTSDKAWKSYISRFHEAMKLEPDVPTTLQAELRDYQKEGFQWLVRLAHWGVGACLADDMGLGKTVQAIALLLHRASKGPALVVAPTSVAMNWMDEIARFSPTLKIIDYRESNRKKVLDNLDTFDVVICSYGLIQNDASQMEKVKWSTIILDEAQAIKNAATKRSQAVMCLQADVKIVMTGTPIENHLGELWNLFRFINPGLLGSMEKFNNRYANPIVRDESIDVRQKLKKLIHPYILRRTKTQVLKELPSRTEITLHVDMSKDEAALYEALRRDAVDKFANSDLPQGNRQLQILAEITRLRRACCNPSLVLKVGAPASSKLALFAHVIEELLDNNHKALVFSQFVDHLSILKAKLEEMKINYQYLDGSTPAKQRKKRVNDFQSGIGDVFLISLKAGGVGLNLTAADYVIHMDPWWNPAVEDQASDRAHRIGQKRPVTVYRMITKNTIEEKIVAMHKGKRDLADNLLAGADVSGKVNVEELLSLLKEG